MKKFVSAAVLVVLHVALTATASAQTSFSFNTGDPDGRIATASRPSSAGKLEIESADDFVLSQAILLKHATFTGLIDSSSYAIDSVHVEIYRVFPQDSTVPESGDVPTRVNSPSDVAYAERDSASNLSFSTSILNASFTASNSVFNGINPKPNSFTGGDGVVAGYEVAFNVNFDQGILLPAGHYFFVPQVQIADSSTNFFWLSASKPITGGTGPFTPDLQTWIRNSQLDPDWLRVGTDITQQGPFNASFALDGTSPLSPVPEPSVYGLGGAGILLLAGGLRKIRAARRTA